jgi:hypothetical protein
MTVYVDELLNFGWKLRGREVASCHLFTDQVDLSELHDLAERIGMQRAWFQVSRTAPHYDRTAARRRAAIDAGAVAVDRRQASTIWRARREAVTTHFNPRNHLE